MEIVKSQLLINGVAIRLKGVNMHEHNEITGHVIDEATVLKDIKTMKSNNINAMRTCHYLSRNSGTRCAINTDSILLMKLILSRMEWDMIKTLH